MVAYSFQKQFAEPILARGKLQTVRAARKRHAYPGEELQLYTGMRTKQCRLLGRVRCSDVGKVTLRFDPFPGLFIDGVCFDDVEEFARSDGFLDWKALAAFWAKHHPRVENFEGVLISWQWI